VWGRVFGDDGEIIKNGFVLTALITPLMQIIMFGMGSQMSLGDFKGVIKMPKGVAIGVVSSFMVMPIVAFTIVNIFTFSPDPVLNASIAAGVILVGVVPTGLASNVMCFIAKGNLPLSITMTSVSTLLAPIITPLLFVWLAGSLIEIDFWRQMISILHMIILPIIAGFTFNLFYKQETRKAIIAQVSAYFGIIVFISLLPVLVQGASFGQFFSGLVSAVSWFLILPIAGASFLFTVLKGDLKIIKTVLSSFATVGIAVIITVTTSAGRDAFLAVGALLILTNFIHNITGYSLGYGIATLFRMSETDRRTVALECGMQNGGMASGLAVAMDKIATVGLAPAVWGPIMNTTGSALASFWSSRPPEDGSRDDKEEM
jgi:BASS family bile acid:Na+ symporter